MKKVNSSEANFLIQQDAFTPQMILKNAMVNRIVDLNEGFDEESIYKLIYYIEKIVKLDNKNNIPMAEREEIKIRINSYGGYCYELWSAINIIEHLKSIGYKIHTICMGKAMSCGFLLFCSGSKRSVYKYSTLMHHSVASGTWGKVKEMEEDVEQSKHLNEMAKKYILERTNLTKERLDEVDKCKEDWFIDSELALELGIATNII